MGMLLRIGLVVAAGLLTWACGSDSGSSCGPNTCSGCCNSVGKCVPLGSTSASNCGKGGALCQSCSSGQCSNGSCGGGGCANCTVGCCQGGQCFNGDSASACGSGGNPCMLCPMGQACSGGRCVAGPCDATTNPGGCCNNGSPFPGTAPNACGKGGGACRICAANEQCFNQTCIPSAPCDPSCKGCCQNGVCQPGTGINACGKGGAICQQCPGGQNCINQTCIVSNCNPTICPNGCCDKFGQCVPGTSEAACGRGGGGCATCVSGQICQSGTQICVNITGTCNCPTGCCDKNNQCVPGNTIGACGKGGMACQTCGTGQECSFQKCTCTSTYCKGCCVGDTCRAGTETAACGQGGQACQACQSPLQCVGKACVLDCSFTSCYGCCDSQKICHDPPNDSSCGYFGAPCQSCFSPMTCDKWGGVCNNTSACNTSNCTGCCLKGNCVTGTQDSACGEGGVGCEVCGGSIAPQLYCGTDPNTKSLECIPTNSSNWDVMVGQVEVKSGVDWDDFLEGSDPPELYVKVTVGGQTNQTKVAPEGYIYDFNNAFMFTAKASDLTTKIHFEIWDSDLGPDDNIIKCDDYIYPSHIKLQGETITACASDPQNPNFVSITFTFRPK